MAQAPLRIVHVFRAPMGGLFRHVLDLSEAQARTGHAVGIICDSGGSPRADEALGRLSPLLALGLHRVAMPREPGPGDAVALARVGRIVLRARPDIVHGHGAKGGFYGRLAPAGWRRVGRIYTPHGGSAHYGPDSLAGRAYTLIERALAQRTSVFTFESEFVAERFEAMLGDAPHAATVVRNGLAEFEFEPVGEDPDAADVLFLGEFRRLKGVDTLLDALSLLRARLPWEPSALLVGAGPDEASYRAQVQRLELRAVSFRPPMPARQAFRLGRLMAVPSRAESLPYVVIEAAAAHRPLVATRVGGVPEILGPHRDRLIAPDDPGALAAAIEAMLLKSDDERMAEAAALARHVEQSFSIEAMATGVEAAYRKALARV
ncbi:glycosyltransferase family 1 protein [Alsobacter soli]|uniref:Glycosyltransferase family 1 protein n=1 Tax=Alsobacter soli TaxID=2109933 RepID=A0A2T1HUF9_9HYPH|nr:glycosyltransferase family 4 protein [Alsobacter soli]PSC05271.1 glycosyltransferase family 1 protein [Alsobacter soli]